jgi:ATP-binding cassette subfamily F protein uup
VGDLSGGERRRLQLTRLLMDSPNVLLLDEPTNDFDVETLTALEDLLDSFGGTLLVISHDRYFLERVCNTFVGLIGDKVLRDLPRGVDEYLELRALGSATSAGAPAKKESSVLEQKALKKEISRIERAMERRGERISEIQRELDQASSDHTKLLELHSELANLQSEFEELEISWLELNIS